MNKQKIAGLIFIVVGLFMIGIEVYEMMFLGDPVRANLYRYGFGLMFIVLGIGILSKKQTK